MSFEKRPSTAATVGGQGEAQMFRDSQIISQLDFFEGFRAWCAMPARLEWRRTA